MMPFVDISGRWRQPVFTNTPNATYTAFSSFAIRSDSIFGA